MDACISIEGNSPLLCIWRRGKREEKPLRGAEFEVGAESKSYIGNSILTPHRVNPALEI